MLVFSLLIFLLITITFAFNRFESDFKVNIVFNLDRIALNALKILSTFDTLFNFNTIGNSVFQPASVANVLAT